SENADERRKLFEEAAGITKYKQRRRQTFKKLETTEQDLSRVKDIVIEVEKKVASLERQADKAEKARSVKEELRTLEIELAERTYAELAENLAPLSLQISAQEDERQKLTASIDVIEASLAALHLDIIETEKRLSQEQKEIQLKSELVISIEKQMLSNEERKKSQEASLVRYASEQASQDQRVAELELLAAQLEALLKVKQLDCETLRLELGAEKSAFEKAESLLREQRTKVETKRNESAGLSESLNRLRSEEQKLRSEREAKLSQVARDTERTVKLHEQIAERHKTIETVKASITGLHESREAASQNLEAAKASRTLLQSQIDRSKEHLLERRSQLASKAARFEFLKSLLESYEGLPAGIKHLDERRAFGLGSLADRISITDEKYRLAIEAALGEAATYYVSLSAADALEGSAELHRAAKGKVTFITPDGLLTLATELPATPAGLVAATGIVTADDDAVKNVIQVLLASTFILEQGALQDAEALTRDEAFARFRFVTMNGEVAGPRGFIRGGSKMETEGLRIGKQAELQSLTDEKIKLESEQEQAELAVAKSQAELAAISLGDDEDELRRIDQRMTAAEKTLAQSEFEAASFTDELDRIETSADQSRGSVSELELKLTELSPAALQLEQDLKMFGESMSAEQAAIAALEEDVRAGAQKLQAKNMEVQQSQFELEKVRSQIDASERDAAGALRQKGRIEDERQSAEREIFRLAAELETMNANLMHLYTEKDAMQKSIGELEMNYSSQKGEANQNENRLRDLRRGRDVASQMVFEFQQQRSQIELRTESLRTVIKTEYDLDLEVKSFFNDTAFDGETASATVQELKEKLKRMGPVNELALEEFDTEKQRLDFLSSQQKDLLDAELQLRDTIAQINQTAEKQFMETFAAIRQNFIGIFKELFLEGDEADLYLQEKEGEAFDALETNIEIMAKPRGKRPQSITLLSGGEKTLTAIALLFAIYLVKPSPFCILDEVDAPLDDANIDRFVKIIQKFSRDTQFIIVTHNKRTMEAARALYGVTMEEEGISKLVAVRWNDAQKN
ncbi:MAG: chromosome segregation protein SMC, partial [Rhizobacter sp.]|nr:chromosome segregation protein SMC [Chlorobiales bacterium]